MTFIYFVLVLGVVVFIHELGHFIFAKKAGIYVYEFSIGMGPKIYSRKSRKDETIYSIRLLPIGGFVSMAGETVEIDPDVPIEKRFQEKKWHQKVLTVIAGIMFNVILGFIILTIVGLINGVPANPLQVGSIEKDYPASNSELKVGDTILELDGNKITSVDELMLKLIVADGNDITLTVRDSNDEVKDVELASKKIEEDGVNYYKYGFSMDDEIKYGILDSLGYAFYKIVSLIHQMLLLIMYLVTGAIGLNSLSGPVGIFNVVGQSAEAGWLNLLYLVGYLNINVAFINLLPIPAFDGGRLLFLIIEKITGKPINPTVENIMHLIGFVFLMGLMLLVTFNDIIKLI